MEKELWFVKILVAIAVLVGINYAIKFSLKCFRRKFLAVHPEWRPDLDKIIFWPCHVALWVIGIAYTLEVIGYRFNLWGNPIILTDGRNAVMIACVTWILLKWKREIQNNFSAKAVDAQMVFILGRICSILIVVIAGIIILQVLGLDVMPLVAFGGIGAAAVGFASKDVIANFCSGLMIFITRPFTVGENILLPEHNIEGIVEEIGWYVTAVRDKEKRPIYLPNAVFSQQYVVNASRMSHRRILEKICVRYDDFAKVKGLTEEIRKVVAKHPRIDTHLPLLVYFNTFSDSSLDIQVDIYTLATRYEEYLTVKQEVLLSVYEVVMAEGAQMPFPTRLILSKEI